MKILLNITLGLSFICFMATSATAQTPAKEVGKAVEAKQVERVNVATPTPTPAAGTGTATEAADDAKANGMRTRAIAIDEEGVEEEEARPARVAPNGGTTTTPRQTSTATRPKR